MKLELELIKNNETLKGYSHKINMQNNTIIKKKINRLNYSKIKRENENLSYVIHINNYERIYDDLFIIKKNYELLNFYLNSEKLDDINSNLESLMQQMQELQKTQNANKNDYVEDVLKKQNLPGSSKKRKAANKKKVNKQNK